MSTSSPLKTNPLISILIPCYNVSPWLERCLDSILKQTYTEWEGILVNDGSKDNTGEMLEEYAKKDSRFKVIHQENRGLAGARNTALRHMTGEWMTWIDPDDEVKPTYLECLIRSAMIEHEDGVSCDRVLSKILSVYVSGESKVLGEKIGNAIYDAKDFIPNILPNALPGGTRGLYKTTFLKENNIIFDEGVVYAEDYLFDNEVLLRAKRIHTIAETDYIYYIREDIGAVHKAKGTIAQETALFRHRLKHNRELRNKYPFAEEMLGKGLSVTLDRVLTAVFNSPNTSALERKEALKQLGITRRDVYAPTFLKKMQHKMLFNNCFGLLHFFYNIEQLRFKLGGFLRRYIKR